MAFSIDLKGGPKLKHIPISKITPNPQQPRRIFDRDALTELSESIQRYGVITPLTVRRNGDGYLLIAGERRLRASKMAGLETVPCYIIEADDRTSSALALVENLQRKDLDPFEEAEGLLRLTREFGLTQQQAAEQVGKTQAAVANKLRLLKLSADTVAAIRQYKLTERHGRALLSLEDEEEQLAAALHIANKKMNVSQAEEYIEKVKAGRNIHKPRKQIFIKDIRFFLNSVTKAVSCVRSAGIDAVCTQSNDNGNICLTIVIPSQQQRA
ncbi:MAG: ParB/RepB/Spo0J family partition protein [Clostridiaceae bacterium]|nr:ParB/RepB/Spo0J family partition protein [Clostridiaceae bacterium]